MNVQEDLSCTPPEIREIAESAAANLLPNKSRLNYEMRLDLLLIDIFWLSVM